MIKKLTMDDVEPFVDKAAQFHKQVGLPGDFSTASFCSQWRKLMDGQIGHIWAQLLGTHLAQSIGVIVHDDPWTGDKAAAVMFWYVDEKRSGTTGARLFLEMMGWCDENEVTRIICPARLNRRFVQMQDFLIGVGFMPKEVNFVAEI